ncbi:MAG TPA: hypothetical protein PK701_07850 [Bacteroidales bacterium]|jgi:hypothetical protein|nr:hypothetical protein [Bacteroidales bacterium]
MPIKNVCGKNKKPSVFLTWINKNKVKSYYMNKAFIDSEIQSRDSDFMKLLNH